MLAAGASVEWLSLVLPALFIWATQVLSLLFICRKFDIPIIYAFTTPLGLSLFYTALLISTVNIMRGTGVQWKGRRVYERAGVSLPVRGVEMTNSVVDE